MNRFIEETIATGWLFPWVRAFACPPGGLGQPRWLLRTGASAACSLVVSRRAEIVRVVLFPLYPVTIPATK